MKKLKFLAIFLVLTLAMTSIFAGCSLSYSQSDVAYYFSSSSEELIAYDEASSNLDTAGYYYYFTSDIDATITIDIRIQLSSYQALYFYLNGEQIKSDTPTGAYTHKYADLTLAKGDKLTFHVFATNSFYALEDATDLQYFVIDSYVLTELSSLQN
ncbi:MAG: hypothetical protein R3Y23_02985 [Bacillota bacterium]